MNYQFIYDSIITHAKNENRKKLKRTNSDYVYYELHHIKPKSLFPALAKDKTNLVLLTAKEHYICHLLLDKIYPNSNMFIALWRLVNDNQNKHVIKGSNEYKRLKENYKLSETHKQNIKAANIKRWQEDGEKIREKIKLARAKQNPDTLKGIKRTDEQRKRISEGTKKGMANMSSDARERMQAACFKPGHSSSQKGNKLSDEQKLKISERVKASLADKDKSIFNSLIINNGQTEKRISRQKDEVMFWLNQGWKKGRLK